MSVVTNSAAAAAARKHSCGKRVKCAGQKDIMDIYIYHSNAVEEVKLWCDSAAYRKIRLLLCFFARLAQQMRRRDRVNMIRLTAICVSLSLYIYIYIYNETIRLSAEPNWRREWT